MYEGGLLVGLHLLPPLNPAELYLIAVSGAVGVKHICSLSLYGMGIDAELCGLDV